MDTDNDAMDIASVLGVYDSTKEWMHLPKDVQITNNDGYNAQLKSADVDFKAGSVTSRDPSHVSTKDLSVTSNEMRATDGGHIIEFTGGVHSTLIPTATPLAPTNPASTK